MSEAALLSEARAALLLAEDQAFASSPLAEVENWLDGAPVPSALWLRDRGFVSEIPDNEELTRLRLVRRAFIRRFGFSIPCSEAVAAVCALSPVLEVGAGTGYWSRLLSSSGADVVATDPNEEQYGFKTSSLHDVRSMNAEMAITTFPSRSLFCSWPTKDSGWLGAAIDKLEPATSVAIIGEDRGGETASDSLFDVLEQITHVATIQIPCFPTSHDRLRIYRK